MTRSARVSMLVLVLTLISSLASAHAQPESASTPGTATAPTQRWVFEPGVGESSAAVADGVVYVSGSDGVGGSVFALDAATGTEIWRAGLIPPNSVMDSSPVVANSVVYIGNGSGYVHALDATTGEERWAFRTGDAVLSSPTVVNGTVYSGSNDGNLYAIDAGSGAERWRLETGGPVWSTPAVADGVVYIASRDGSLYAADAATGTARWQFTTRAPIESSPAVESGVVYVGSDDGSLCAIDAATGSERWAFATGAPVRSSPAVAEGAVYVGSDDGSVYAIDAETGMERWAFATGDEVAASPAVADGIVYIGSLDDSVYALDAETGEERWRREAERLVDLYLSWYDEYGALLAPYTSHSMPRVVFMIALTVNSFARYLLIDDNPRIRRLIVDNVDDMIAHCLGPDGIPYYKELPSLRRPAPTPHLLESLAYAYRYTGEVKYLKLATRVFPALERGEATAHGTAKFVDESGAVIAGHGGGRIFASTYPSVLLYAAEAAPAGLLDWYEYPY